MWTKSAPSGVHGGDVEAGEQRQLLQHHGPLAPGAALQHGVAGIVVGSWRLEGGLPVRHILPGEEAGVAAAGDVQHFGADEAVDRLGNEALIPGLVRRLDPGLPRGPGGLAEQALPGGCEGGIGKELVDGGDVAARQPDLGAAGPFLLEERADALDGGGDARDERDAVLGVADGEGEHVRQLPRAPVAQHPAPGAERAGHGGGEEAGSGDEVEAERAERLDRGGGGGWALAADDGLPPGGGVVDDDGGVAARAVEVGFGDLQGEGGGGGGVERVAAALQHGLAHAACQPMRRGDDAERAGDLGAGGEHGRSP